MISHRLQSLLAATAMTIFPLSLAASETALTAGQSSKGYLDAEATGRYVLTLAQGDFVRGALAGTALHLRLRDAQGKHIRQLASGQGEVQPFMFVAGDASPYTLEIRTEQSGAYRLAIEEIVPLAAQTPPTSELASPRLRALAKTLAEGGDSQGFWQEIERQGTPLIESSETVPDLDDDERLVTFLWRGARHNVRLLGGPSNDHDALQRLADSDVWFKTYRTSSSTRLSYRLAPDVPELDAPARLRRRAILATAQADPLNPRRFPAQAADRFNARSVLELPDAPSQPWVEPRADTPSGELVRHRLQSDILGNTRNIYLYRAATYRPGKEGNALLVLFDAEAYLQEVPTPTILDNMVAAGIIPPTAAILIDNPSRESRSRELPPNPDFARFLAAELMPWAREQGIYADAGLTVIAGASYGGLAATYAGFTHPELFGNVLSQSGSFWWAPGSEPGVSGGEAGWLARQFIGAPRKPLRFYLEAGRFETHRANHAGILETTRHLRDVLRALDYPVHYRDYSSGHDYYHWRGTLGTGLQLLIGIDKDAADS
ncbi:enterochelin esterase [Alkalilimnicola ehrlichii]|nr:enterochelin esterase [Alkalilimnicola ehrlichii]